MSIMPKGGWGDLGRQDLQEKPYANQNALSARSSFLSCKICDSGTLSSQKVFRLSGPAVVIGFILLIPSVLGMICSVLMLLGVITAAGTGMGYVASRPSRPFQSAFDAGFRRSCAKNFRLSYERSTGTSASMSQVEQACECVLSALKQTGSETLATQTCTEEAEEGSLAAPKQDVDEFYDPSVSRRLPESIGAKREAVGFLGLFGFIGSFSAIAFGIASFVGGLLGWLLVMKKRVLQCDCCGAVVNAS
jgi:hypothetical protein